MPRFVVERATDGSAILALDVADSFAKKLRGLIGRSTPDVGKGLYFPGSNSIHMLFMAYPIDCVFVAPVGGADAEIHEVIALSPNLRPWTGVVWFVRRAKGTIELAAGGAAHAGLSVGDRLRLIPVEI